MKKSPEILENMIRDQGFTRYAVCQCFKNFDNAKQVFVHENLLEVQALCGPHVPYQIYTYSDCLHCVSYMLSFILSIGLFCG
jgi:hypothetical protein